MTPGRPAPEPPRPHDELGPEDFDYALPAELIAQHPAADRAASRLLDASADPPVDRRFAELPGLLAPGDLVVFNDTRVIRARLHGHKPSGGRVELLVERIVAADRAWALVRTSHAPHPGTRFVFGSGPTAFAATVLGRDDDRFELHFDTDLAAALERAGELPLPPYIDHRPGPEDEERYQTVYARAPGAVAAPTAGLHFTPALLAAIDAAGARRATVTLHVGAGTFQPIRATRLADHRMHREHYEIPAATAQAWADTRTRGGRVVAVGTTTLRALESAMLGSPDSEPPTLPGPGAGATELFIRPGFRFRAVDALVTNFHLPRSSLLVLVSAFAGHASIRAAYAHAIDRRYRFFSYGDAMWLVRPDPARPA